MARRSKPTLGQHFLHDRLIAERIVDAVEAGGWTVLEVGPGRGALTLPLTERAEKVVAVELDRQLAGEMRVDPRFSSVTIINADILDRPMAQWVDPLPEEGILVAGNLPYQITSPVIFACLESRAAIQRCVLMIQREVAERLVAGPGSRRYGIISVLVAIHADRKILFKLGKGAFQPPPSVESAVISLEMRKEPVGGVDTADGPDFEWVTSVVKAAFGQRRKMMKNSLEAGLSHLTQGELMDYSTRAGIDLQRRAETMSPEEFVELARMLPAPDAV
jgi:16S rRNA (adenine1518-N6/adenine1519-N6)-dimethyltransferase